MLRPKHKYKNCKI